MELTHWQYIGALGGVIGIGWLVVVPMYRGWKPLNERMSERVRSPPRCWPRWRNPTVATPDRIRRESTASAFAELAADAAAP